MALKPTIYKVQLELADSDNNRYDSLGLTLAQHPSETLERLAARLLAYCLNAGRGLEFTRGLSTADEPDLWQHSDNGEIAHWIEVGQPDEKCLRRAAGRSNQVCVFSYGGEVADSWWQQNRRKLQQMDKLTVYRVPQEASLALAETVQRTMQLQCTIEDGSLMVTDGEQTIQLEMLKLK